MALLRSLGVNVGLGTDGPASGNTLDLFTQMRMCENFHKNTLKTEVLSCKRDRENGDN